MKRPWDDSCTAFYHLVNSHLLVPYLPDHLVKEHIFERVHYQNLVDQQNKLYRTSVMELNELFEKTNWMEANDIESCRWINSLYHKSAKASTIGNRMYGLVIGRASDECAWYNIGTDTRIMMRAKYLTLQAMINNRQSLGCDEGCYWARLPKRYRTYVGEELGGVTFYSLAYNMRDVIKFNR